MTKKKNNNSIIETIKNSKIAKKPRWHFVVSKIINILGLIIIGLAIVYLVSFFIYILKVNGLLFLPSFGLFGLGVLFKNIPWLIIIIVGVLIILFEYLVSKVKFIYKKPLIYSLIVIIAITLFSGYLLANNSQIHPRMMKKALDNNLPVGGQFYRGYGLYKSNDFHIGQILSSIDQGYLVELKGGEKVKVLVDDQTYRPCNISLELGKEVVIIGELKNGAIDALGIRPIDSRGDQVKGSRYRGMK
jgi:hypothetical protein